MGPNPFSPEKREFLDWIGAVTESGFTEPEAAELVLIGRQVLNAEPPVIPGDLPGKDAA